MRRSILLTLAVLGAVTSLAGVSGVIALGSDRATTATNTFQTGTAPRIANVQMATWNRGAGTCGTYTEDLTTAVHSTTDALRNGTAYSGTPVCIRNSSPSATVDLTMRAIELQDVDFDCTGDEGTADTTCGNNLQGELSGGTVVNPSATKWSSCASNATFTGSTFPSYFSTLTAGGAPLGALTPGQVLCLTFSIGYNPSDEQYLVSQSDRLTWRYAFDAVVTGP